MNGCITFSTRKSCLLLLLAFCCILRCCANAAGEKQRRPIKSAVVVGTVYCDTCFLQKLSKSSHFIPGATVAVECRDSTAKSRFRKETKTNRHGVFRVPLPLSISRHIDSIKSCQVSLIKSNQPFCTAAAASATSAGLSLKYSRRNGVLVFSAGFFAFKPLTQPELCYQELKPLDPAKPAFIPFFPPNPLFPPPSLLPPVIPSPPPSVLPPFFPTPPPSLLPPILPPVPGIPLPLLSPPPPPPASIFPPFPFPLPPNPLFPGIPPASPPAETLP